jgi:DNA-binding response OmpR family regulator
LRAREAADAGLDRVLAQAAQARAAGHLDDGENAALLHTVRGAGYRLAPE